LQTVNQTVITMNCKKQVWENPVLVVLTHLFYWRRRGKLHNPQRISSWSTRHAPKSGSEVGSFSTVVWSLLLVAGQLPKRPDLAQLSDSNPLLSHTEYKLKSSLVFVLVRHFEWLDR